MVAMPNLFTDLALDKSSNVGGVVRNQSYITPKSGDTIEQTGQTIGTLRREARDTKLRGSHSNSRWVVGKALIEGTEVWYQEDFTDRTTANIGGQSVITRNKELARQIVVLCEGPIEGIEKIFIDGHELELLQTVGQYGDRVNILANVIIGSNSTIINSISKNPISGEVYAVATARVGDRGSYYWIGVINPRTLQFEAIGDWRQAISFTRPYIAFDKQGNLYGLIGCLLYTSPSPRDS